MLCRSSEVTRLSASLTFVAQPLTHRRRAPQFESLVNDNANTSDVAFVRRIHFDPPRFFFFLASSRPWARIFLRRELERAPFERGGYTADTPAFLARSWTWAAGVQVESSFARVLTSLTSSSSWRFSFVTHLPTSSFREGGRLGGVCREEGSGEEREIERENDENFILTPLYHKMLATEGCTFVRRPRLQVEIIP